MSQSFVAAANAAQVRQWREMASELIGQPQSAPVVSPVSIIPSPVAQSPLATPPFTSARSIARENKARAVTEVMSIKPYGAPSIFSTPGHPERECLLCKSLNVPQENNRIRSRNFSRHLLQVHRIQLLKPSDNIQMESDSRPEYYSSAEDEPPPAAGDDSDQRMRVGTSDMEQLPADAEHIQRYIVSRALGGKSETQTLQDVARIGKMLVWMARRLVPDEPPTAAYEKRLVLLRDQALLTDVVEYLLTQRKIQVITNWTDALAQWMRHLIHNDMALRTDVAARTEFEANIEHLRIIGKGIKKRGARDKAQRLSVESLEKRGRWATMEELKAIVLGGEPRAREIYQKRLRAISPEDAVYMAGWIGFYTLVDSSALRGGELPALKYDTVVKTLDTAAPGAPVIIQTDISFKTFHTAGAKAFELGPDLAKWWRRYAMRIRPSILACARADSDTSMRSDVFFVNSLGRPFTNYAQIVVKTVHAICDVTGTARITITPTIMRKIEATAAIEHAARTGDRTAADAMRIARGHSDTTSQRYYEKVRAEKEARDARQARQAVFGTVRGTAAPAHTGCSDNSDNQDHEYET